MGFNKDLVKGRGEINKEKELLSEEKNKHLKMIPVNQIYENQWNINFRKQTEDEFTELKKSISDLGLLDPVTVRLGDYNKGGYELISGHHRKKACEELGITEIPAHIVSFKDDADAELALIDANIVNRKMNDMEIAKVIQRKKELYSIKYGSGSINTTKAIAEELNMSQTQVKMAQRLNKLIPELQEMIENGELPSYKGQELALLAEETQKSLYDAFQNKINNFQVSELKAMKSKNQEELESYISQIAEKNKELEEKEKEIAEKEKELAKKESELQSAVTSKNSLENKIKALENEVDELQNQDDSSDEIPEEALIKISLLEEQIKKINTEKENLEKHQNQLKKEIQMKKEEEKLSEKKLLSEVFSEKNIILSEKEKKAVNIIDNLDKENIEAIMSAFQKLK